MLYDVTPDTPRGRGQTEKILNSLRYEERRKMFEPPKPEAGLVGWGSRRSLEHRSSAVHDQHEQFVQMKQIAATRYAVDNGVS